MSRQAGPSIILSVLIVSFFAVALFQQDLNRTRIGRSRSSLRKSVDNSPPSDPVSARFDQGRSMVHSSHVAEPAGVSTTRTDRSGYPNLPRVTTAPADFAGDVHEIRTGGNSKPPRRNFTTGIRSREVDWGRAPIDFRESVSRPDFTIKPCRRPAIGIHGCFTFGVNRRRVGKGIRHPGSS